MTRGGKREGSGRPPAPEGEKKVAYATKLEPQVVEFLRQCGNGAKAIEQAIRRSKAFREWMANRR